MLHGDRASREKGSKKKKKNVEGSNAGRVIAREEERPSLTHGEIRETDRDGRVIEIINRGGGGGSGRVKRPQEKKCRGKPSNADG